MKFDRDLYCSTKYGLEILFAARGAIADLIENAKLINDYSHLSADNLKYGKKYYYQILVNQLKAEHDNIVRSQQYGDTKFLTGIDLDCAKVTGSNSTYIIHIPNVSYDKIYPDEELPIKTEESRLNTQKVLKKAIDNLWDKLQKVDRQISETTAIYHKQEGAFDGNSIIGICNINYEEL
jgi:hypothetical protein